MARVYSVGATFLLAFAVNNLALAQVGCYHDGVRLDGTRDGNGQIKCIYQPGQTGGSNSAALERERANLRQREAELQQQIDRDRATQQRIRSEQARQQQQRRNSNAQQWQQLQSTFQAEMDRINQENERKEAEEREGRLRGELEALQRQLEEARNAATAAASTASPSDSTTTTAKPPTTQEANPFANAAQADAGVMDPNENHAGKVCAYFTQPMVRADGSGMNTYTNGSMICYGKRMYKCVDRRWTDAHRCDMYQGWQNNLAEKFERSTLGQ